MNPNLYPPPPRAKAGGFYYLARLLGKIRQHARHELHADFHANMGIGMDARMCRFLQVDYAQLKEFVLTGKTDEEVVAWCQIHGRKLVDEDVVVWNGFVSKRGSNDEATPILDKYKAEAGFSNRPEIATFFDLFEAEENQK
ncbi:MAG: DUF5069 domain-containing protein [Candidatus Didemnitutus sp.]|nr:DUF5069 domain-containing protein [Candidatus Didemnitutus sp.]